jgi:pyridinium-3,5-bisthiocarboxylic acid mononucleotide nickel chelatase
MTVPVPPTWKRPCTPYHAHVDCFSGAAGDMLLAACLDASERPQELLSYVTYCLTHGIPDLSEGAFNITMQRVRRGRMASIAGVHVQVHSKYGHSPAPVPTADISNNDDDNNDNSQPKQKRPRIVKKYGEQQILPSESSLYHHHDHGHTRDHGHVHSSTESNINDDHHHRKTTTLEKPSCTSTTSSSYPQQQPPPPTSSLSHTHNHHGHTHSHNDEGDNNNNNNTNPKLLGPLRNLPQIQTMLQDASDQWIPPWVKTMAIATFTNLAQAEATTHGVETVLNVHFHEVGAIDSIVDTVGTLLALYCLHVTSVSCSRLPIGEGTVWTSHGCLPVPAPATLRLMVNMPTCPGPLGVVTGELVTPTGAALLKTLCMHCPPKVTTTGKDKDGISMSSLASSSSPLLLSSSSSSLKDILENGRPPNFTLRKIGIGAGTKDFDKHPNILRLLLGDNVISSSCQ